MSERLPEHGHESLPSSQENKEQLAALREEIERRAEKQQEQAVSTEALTKSVEQKAISAKEFSVGERKQSDHHPVFVNAQLKEMAYHRSMVRIHKRLSAPAKLFSRITHAKIMERPSEIAEKTVARPSSLLGGGLFAAIGTLALLMITKHYGYQFSYLAAILLFVIGMFCGLGIELLYRMVKRNR